MFVHVVLIKLKPGFSRTHPQVVEWEAALNALPQKVTGVIGWETGWNVSDRPIAYDYALISRFATRENLDAYGPHPAHQDVVVKLRQVADWVICDYPLGEWVSD